VTSETGCRLYLITPPRVDPAAFGPILEAALDAGDVACVQLRLKDMDDDTVRRACDILRPIVQDRDAAMILNDRPDLAIETGCDGVHIGQTDRPYRDTRDMVGPDRIIGVTCHDSRHLAIDAAEAGADYVAFGAFYPTATKQPPSWAKPELLRWWADVMTVPSVAIGGITVDNGRALVEAGADFLAVSAGVWDHPDGAAASVRRFNEIFR
jgi:thiamine-phosphate pyrophosphorylase